MPLRFSLLFTGFTTFTTFTTFTALISTGLLAPLPVRAQAPLVPVVPIVPSATPANPAADKNRRLPVIEASDLFASARRDLEKRKIVYLVVRAFPGSQSQSEKRAPENKAGSDAKTLHYDAASKTLTLLGGFSRLPDVFLEDPGGDRALPDPQKLSLGSNRTLGKPRNEKLSDGTMVSITPVISSNYSIELSGMAAFDPRLFNRNTGQFTAGFRPVDEKDIKGIGRTHLIVIGIRDVKDLGISLTDGGTFAFPPNPSPELRRKLEKLDRHSNAYRSEYWEIKATLTDVFVVEAVTKKVVLHYVPKPSTLSEPPPR